jgi:hypothetical protein
MTQLAKYSPALVTLTGAVWLIAVTVSNMYYFYYGWIPKVYTSAGRQSWNVEEVNQIFAAYGVDGRDRIVSQLLPLCVVLLGAATCLVQNYRSARSRP